MADRGRFEFTDYESCGRVWTWPQGVLEAISGDMGVSITITQEHAVDSRNSEFSSTVVLPPADAIRLRDWLSQMLA